MGYNKYVFLCFLVVIISLKLYSKEEIFIKDATKCLHSGYTPENGGPGVMPIVQSTTYAFNTTKEVGDLFDMPTAHMYSRFSNPTTDAVEKKIAE